MANVAAHLVDRVLPDVPVRQYVLTLPYELRRLAAFKADALTALARIFVEAVFARYLSRAGCDGIENPQCGSVNFVQRFGSLNLHVHFHLLALDGVFARDARGGLVFHPAEAPTQTALDACAAIAMGRGTVSTLLRGGAQDDEHGAAEERPDRPVLAVERHGFNVHAGVRIEAGDDLGRERLARYGARPPLSLERLRRLPGGRVAYRLKYVDRGRRGKNRVMTGIEFMARLAAIIAPPRYPLVRFAGVLAPRSAWRREVVPKPRERGDACEAARAQKPGPTERRLERHAAGHAPGGPAPRAPSTPGASDTHHGPAVSANDVAMSAVVLRPALLADDVTMLAPNVISVRHWDRLLGGLLYATSPRVEWATLLRRSFSVDVLECPRAHRPGLHQEALRGRPRREPSSPEPAHRRAAPPCGACARWLQGVAGRRVVASAAQVAHC
jgi:hypothetical protein